MNYVQFHIGDWESGTRLLKPLEKGIYIDLLMLYYSSERPLIRTNFERITRGYTAEEKEAFDYVISSFFEEREDGFHNSRCDEEIRKAAEKSEKARKSIQARWNKAAKAPRSGDANTDSSTDVALNVSANEIRTNNERNTDVLLTNNQEPITNKEKDICAKPSDFAPDSPADGFALEQKNPFSESGNVPVQKIVDIYNEVLGESLGRVVKVTPSRAQAIRARWRDILHDCECADTKAGLEMVRDYFKAVSQSNFLMGRTNNPNHPNWRADFDFLLKQKTYTGILEKRYSNGR